MKPVTLVVLVTLAAACGGTPQNLPTPVVERLGGEWTADVGFWVVGGDPTLPEPPPAMIYAADLRITSTNDSASVSGLCPNDAVFVLGHSSESPYWRSSEPVKCMTGPVQCSMSGCACEQVTAYLHYLEVELLDDDQTLKGYAAGKFEGCGVSKDAMIKFMAKRLAY